MELAASLAPEQPLWASPGAISQMQALVDTYAGPLERARWMALKQQLNTLHSKDLASILNPAANASLASQNTLAHASVPGSVSGQAHFSSPCDDNAMLASASQTSPSSEPDSPPTTSKLDLAASSASEVGHSGASNRLSSTEAATDPSAPIEGSAGNGLDHIEAGPEQVAEQLGLPHQHGLGKSHPEHGARGGASRSRKWTPQEAMQPAQYTHLANMPVSIGVEETPSCFTAHEAPLGDQKGAAQQTDQKAEAQQSASKPGRTESQEAHCPQAAHPNRNELGLQSGGQAHSITPPLHSKEQSQPGAVLAPGSLGLLWQVLTPGVHDLKHLPGGVETAASGPSQTLELNPAASPQQLVDMHGLETGMAPPQARATFLAAVQARSLALEGRVGKSQREVLAIGDLAQALTLTANARAAHAVEAAGLHVPIQVHRAVWLSGL